jgi:hypothetical protein
VPAHVVWPSFLSCGGPRVNYLGADSKGPLPLCSKVCHPFSCRGLHFPPAANAPCLCTACPPQPLCQVLDCATDPLPFLDCVLMTLPFPLITLLILPPNSLSRPPRSRTCRSASRAWPAFSWSSCTRRPACCPPPPRWHPPSSPLPQPPLPIRSSGPRSARLPR